MIKKLNDEQIADLATEYAVEFAALKAFISVESGGKGFYDNGDPVILFEGHHFYRLLPNSVKDKNGLGLRDRTARNYPNLCYPKWTKEFYGYSSVKRLRVAMSIHKEAALMSCSWGMMQVMGFNYKKVGYDNVVDFVEAMDESEMKQIEAGLNYLVTFKLIKPLRQKKWAVVAEGYNGSGYKKNSYDTKLAEAYNKYLPLQNELTANGILG